MRRKTLPKPTQKERQNAAVTKYVQSSYNNNNTKIYYGFLFLTSW